VETVRDSNAVATFDRHENAEAALLELQRNGFDVRKLSIIGREPHTEEHAVGFYNVGDRAKVWGKRGAFWGTIVGILFGPAFFWIPGVGFIITGGLLSSLLLGTLEGAAAGAAAGAGGSALVAALHGLGIPKDSVVRYEKSIQADKFLLIAHGTQSDVERSSAILENSGFGPVQIHAGGRAA
jgi:uncharacterized membrane protein